MDTSSPTRPGAPASAPRYVNWSANRKSPWHRMTLAEHDGTARTALCGAVMLRAPQWSHGILPTAATGKVEPRLCALCAERALEPA